MEHELPFLRRFDANRRENLCFLTKHQQTITSFQVFR